MDLKKLYEIAAKENIEVHPFPLPSVGSMSCMGHSGDCYIGMDLKLFENEKEEKIRLSHELGHCITGAFYNHYAPCDIKSKHEYRADKWTIERLIPKEEMEFAMIAGNVEVWQLAEYFEVPESLIKKAAWIYFDKTIL